MTRPWLPLTLLAGALAPSAAAQCELQQLYAGDPGANDWFGFHVVLQADRALVGTVWDSNAGALDGSAYVFARTPSGWVQEQKLVAADPEADDMFGISVSLSGSRALIGSYRDDDNGSDSGSAYVFDRSGTLWSESAKINPADGAATDRFGWDLALSGDVALVGAYLDDDLGSASGSAYVFEFDGAQWVEVQKLLASDGTAGDWFGQAVAIDGERALIGAWGHDGAGDGSGAVYVFERAGPSWVETQKLVAADAQAGDGFGFALSLSGDEALVGATRGDGAAVNTGAAYVFERAGGTWVPAAKLTATDGAPQDRFGHAVSITAGKAAVGANRSATEGVGAGAAYVFEREGTEWVQRFAVGASDAAPSDELGYSVAVLGDTLMVGARWDDDAQTNAGSVYVFSAPDFATPYCTCGGAAPCDNPDSVGGCANSSGSGARLGACGSDSVAADDLAFQADHMPVGQPALLFAGTQTVNGGAGVAFGDGLRCAGGNVVRLGTRTTDGAGLAHWGPGLAASAGWNAGDARFAQAWYRDPAGSPCGAAFNLSHGLEVVLAP